MSDAEELEFELITSARQLAAPPPLRKQFVEVEEWKTTSGNPARFLVWEQTASDYADFLESGWSHRGTPRQRYDSANEDARFLAFCLRDQNGNRVWHKTEEAIGVLGKLGKATINKLVRVATELNSGLEAGKEGNSERTESAS